MGVVGVVRAMEGAWGHEVASWKGRVSLISRVVLPEDQSPDREAGGTVR
jgi:hypothetical protein